MGLGSALSVAPAPVDHIRRRFRLPEYGGAKFVWNQLRCTLGFIPYAWIHPEEGLAERVGSLHPRTVRALAKALQM